MHNIYTTLGFIISSRPYGDADRLLQIFTRDLGLINATARGIRLEKSKLRYLTQDYSFGTYSLVKGKEFWRLTDAQSISQDQISRSDSKIESWETPRLNELTVRIASLLRRLLQGEETHEELFDCVYSCQKFLSVNVVLSDEKICAVESVVVARILSRLGYIGNNLGFSQILDPIEIDDQMIDGSIKLKPVLNRHINKALRESHL